MFEIGGVRPAWDVFLSYPAADRDRARRLYGALSKRLRVFMDVEQLGPGDWAAGLVAAQRSSRATVVLVSRNTDAAYFQRSEILSAIALARRGRHVLVPVYLDGMSAASEEVLFTLRLLHALDAGSFAGVEPLADALEHALATETDTSVPVPATPEHPLHAYPRGPMVEPHEIPQSLVRQYGRFLRRDECEAVIAQAAAYRREADPDDKRVTFVRAGDGQAHRRVFAMLAESESLDYARDVAQSYVASAIQSLGELPVGDARASLTAVADFVLARRR